MTEQQVYEAAAAAGLVLKTLHAGLYEVQGTWTQVIISNSTGPWRLCVYRRCNRFKRWRTFYQGPRLATALRHANRWVEVKS